jgi:enoyl-CoA hydratase/carnithine racemase
MRTTFETYSTAYRHVAMRRVDGILELRLHSDGGPLVWGASPHTELGDCFAEIGSDPENRVVIITGTGGEFLAKLDQSWVGEMNPKKWDRIYTNGKRLLMNLLEIEVPVIGVLNGPAKVHAELAALSDIVIAADHAYVQDAPHFRAGTVPSDGVHIIWPMLLGPNRGRHFLLTGRKITAPEALEYGLVAEVHPGETVVDRAWEIARDLARQPDITLRYTRVALTQRFKRALLDDLGYGLALEGLGAYGSWPR